jgi:hypothetical protein
MFAENKLTKPHQNSIILEVENTSAVKAVIWLGRTAKLLEKNTGTGRVA